MNKVLKVVFMGSADVSCVVLRALAETPSITITGVVTQPDRPCGRQLRMRPCLCKADAERFALPIITPPKLNQPAVWQQLELWNPDVIIVVAYGQFLGRRILELPPLGCLNVHLSLLPRHRGAAPVQHAIAAGDTISGVTIIKMDSGMDSGAILMRQQEAIYPTDDAGALHDRLSTLGASLLLHTLPLWQAGAIAPEPQDESLVTFAPKLRREEGELQWHEAAERLALRVRAFNPWPGCYTWVHSGRSNKAAQRLKVLRAVAEPFNNSADALPGTVIDINDDGPAIATAKGALRLLTVQREGGRPLDGATFLRGCPLSRGEPINCGDE